MKPALNKPKPSAMVAQKAGMMKKKCPDCGKMPCQCKGMKSGGKVKKGC